MPNNTQTAQYHSNRYHALSACEHCEGIVRHESWCITIDQVVLYAYQIVADPSKLTVADGLILHSLGVTWAGKACEGSCKRTGAANNSF